MSDVRGPRPKLVILNSPMQGQEFALTSAVTIIGRSPECDIMLDTPSVSRQHARIEEKAGSWTARDMGSRNGIKLGGQAVQECPLSHGDVLSVGDIQMRLEMPPVAPPPPAPVAPAAPPRPRKSAVSAPSRATAPAAIASLKVKLIVSVIIGLIVAIAGGAALLWYMARPQGLRTAEMSPVVVRVNENKWIRVQGPQKISIDGAKPVWLRLGDFNDVAVCPANPPPGGANVGGAAPADSGSNIVTARKYDTGELVLFGVAGGDAVVSLTMASGSIVTMRVLVRGRVEDPIEELKYLPLTEEERLSRANQCVTNGRLLEKDHPYLALQEYRKALVLLEPVKQKGEDFLTARSRAEAAEGEVARRWETLRKEIANAAHNGDRTRQMQLLEDATKLIPEPNDPRNQKAQASLSQMIEEEIRNKDRRGGGR